jgi:hypothetical protein
MKFLGTYKIDQDKYLPILKKWISMSPQQQGDAGAEVTIIGRWHDVAGRRGMAIFETNDAAALARYLGLWNPYMEIEVAPVFDDAEVTEIGRHIVAASGG